MDLALSLASNDPCRCRIIGGDGCENCVSVTLIVPAVPAEDQEAFPLLCRPAVEENSMDDILVTSSQMQRRQQNRFQPDTTQQHAFQRIQVRHVAGMEDLMHYLLSLAGLPVEQQPVGGILIDGLDQMVHHQSQDAASHAIRKNQIGKL